MPFWVRMTRTSESIVVLCHEPAAFFLPPFVNEILHVSNAGMLYLFNGQHVSGPGRCVRLNVPTGRTDSKIYNRA